MVMLHLRVYFSMMFDEIMGSVPDLHLGERGCRPQRDGNLFYAFGEHLLCFLEHCYGLSLTIPDILDWTRFL